MLASSVRDRPPSFGQAERRVNGNEVGPGLMDRVQDVLIAARDSRVGPQATQEAYTGRTARRTGEVYAEHNKRFAVRRNDSLAPPALG